MHQKKYLGKKYPWNSAAKKKTFFTTPLFFLSQGAFQWCGERIRQAQSLGAGALRLESHRFEPWFVGIRVAGEPQAEIARRGEGAGADWRSHARNQVRHEPGAGRIRAGRARFPGGRRGRPWGWVRFGRWIVFCFWFLWRVDCTHGLGGVLLMHLNNIESDTIWRSEREREREAGKEERGGDKNIMRFLKSFLLFF